MIKQTSAALQPISTKSARRFSHLRLVNTPTILRMARSHLDHTARLKLAEDPMTPSTTLRILATDEDPDVRIGVAENPNVSPAALFCLIHDVSADVRYAMAENHRLVGWALSILCQDENPFVACRAEKTLARWS